MTLNRGWVWTQLLAFDRAFAALLFNRSDVTISALCDLALISSPAAAFLNPAQRAFLRVVGRALNAISPGHCLHAVQTDIATARSTLALLAPTVQSPDA